MQTVVRGGTLEIYSSAGQDEPWMRNVFKKRRDVFDRRKLGETKQPKLSLQ